MMRKISTEEICRNKEKVKAEVMKKKSKSWIKAATILKITSPPGNFLDKSLKKIQIAPYQANTVCNYAPACINSAFL